MYNNLDYIAKTVLTMAAEEKVSRSAIKALKSNINQIEQYYLDLQKARWVLNEVSKQTQERFKSKVESLVTTAIRSVYGRALRFELIFEEKRNRFECKPVIWEGDVLYENPDEEMGGGILDVISFALRVILWYLSENRTRNVLILDEPMKFVGRRLIHQAGRMLREISYKLGLQIILVTHEDELIEIGDKCYHVGYENGESIVKLLNSNGEKDKPKMRKLMIKDGKD